VRAKEWVWCASGRLLGLLRRREVPARINAVLICEALAVETSGNMEHAPATPLNQCTMLVEITSSSIPFSLSRISARCATSPQRKSAGVSVATACDAQGQNLAA
jgi:hypothetical protein